MSLDEIEQRLFDVLDNKVIGAIEHLYFSDSKQKRMLLGIGIYERDIDNIISVIGNDFEDVFEMKNRLINSYSKLHNIGYISQFVIRNL